MSRAFLFAVNDFPPLLGGEATLYHALVRRLVPGEAVVLAPEGTGDAAVDAALPVPIVRRRLPPHGGEWSRVVRTVVGGFHLARLLLRRKFDYLVCGQLLSIGVPMSLLARCLGLPYAVFVHGADLADYARGAGGRILSRFVVAGAHTVIANSHFTAALIDRLLPGTARRILVLPMGVDPAPPIDAPRVERWMTHYRLGPGPVLLTVARLVPMKGHDVVIEALPHLLEEFPRLVYLVVGDGPHRGMLERLARERGVAEHVIFAGHVSSGDLAAHYALATLFVQLSRATTGYDGLEGFGLTFLEAASHGVPSIAGRSGGVPEAVADGRSGLLIAPGDPAAFAGAAKYLLSNPAELERLSAGARVWARSHPWEAAARCLRSLSDELTAGAPAGARRIP